MRLLPVESSLPGVEPSPTIDRAGTFDRALRRAGEAEPAPNPRLPDDERARALAGLALIDLSWLASRELATRGPARATTEAALVRARSPGDAPPDRPAPAHVPEGERPEARHDGRAADPDASAADRASARGDAPDPPRSGQSLETSEPSSARADASASTDAPKPGARDLQTFMNPGASPRARSPAVAASGPGVRQGLAPVGAKGAPPREIHAPIRATPAPRVRPEAFQNLLARGLAAAMRAKDGEVTLRLEPRALGFLRIRLEVEGSKVKGVFEASSTRARDLLNENLGVLRASLESRGLTGQDLAVRIMDDPPREPSAQGASVGGDDHPGAERESSEAPGDRPPWDRDEDRPPERWRFDPGDLVLGTIEPGHLDATA